MSSTASASTNHTPALSLSLASIHPASSPPYTPPSLDTEDGDGDGGDGDRQEAPTYSSLVRMQSLPLVSGALSLYEAGKANSRVVQCLRSTPLPRQHPPAARKQPPLCRLWQTHGRVCGRDAPSDCIKPPSLRCEITGITACSRATCCHSRPWFYCFSVLVRCPRRLIGGLLLFPCNRGTAIRVEAPILHRMVAGSLCDEESGRRVERRTEYLNKSYLYAYSGMPCGFVVGYAAPRTSGAGMEFLSRDSEVDPGAKRNPFQRGGNKRRRSAGITTKWKVEQQARHPAKQA
ncbi:hypothetical protein B0H13DRAFT_1924982 [Mycena leptocephala]|nr:hypothetical protein B0H13DRAFT_1924982 [Mycena leptocephala]